ncbi:PhzF family phenazine biosynthesis protein [Aggregatilinea lenta]|uniref:PhzF family phenazine biosynthesis protein n=1 Tax=Aggregatilinea lenta TaxID=913108 RepID=UPI000E5A6344|nr:PhzF family phenazine biosynthesis protein [Aggregatilinea lenta]
MPRYTFYQADVFTDQAFGGNPLAVFPDADGLDTAQMQRIAREMNLSETTFVFPPGDPQADFKVRIFTPASELPFAGHPVVGTHWMLAHLGRIALTEPVTTVRLELGVGVRASALHVEDGRVTRVVMDHQRPQFGATASAEQVERLAHALNLSPAAITDTGWPVRVVSTGVWQLFVPVRSLADAQELGINRIDTGALGAIFAELDPETHCHDSVMVLTRETVQADADVHTRMFAPALGVGEDPATGSATGGLGAYLVEHGIVPATPPTTHLMAEQGLEIHRPSRLGIEVDGTPGNVEMVRVSGQVVPLLEGVLEW